MHCELYQINIYPREDHFPDSALDTFYNNSNKDGVNLNVKLVGNVKS